MSDLLFYALLLALLYYFFIYSKPKSRPHPLTQEQATQTDQPTITGYEPGSARALPDPTEFKKLQADISQKERTIIGLNESYDKLAKKFDNLKEQLTKLTSEQTTEAQQTELALDQLIKNLKDLTTQIE